MEAARPFAPTKPASYVRAWLRDVPGATLEMVAEACRYTTAKIDRGEKVDRPNGYVRTKLAGMVEVGWTAQEPGGSVDWAKKAEELLADVEAAGGHFGISYNGQLGLYPPSSKDSYEDPWKGFLRRFNPFRDEHRNPLKDELRKFPTVPNRSGRPGAEVWLTLPTAEAGRPTS
jgi:hypothetical protein